MATIVASASKQIKERRHSDAVRIKVGHMLTFDHLTHAEDISERNTLRKVVRANQIRNQGCLSLPLTIGYFLFYCQAAWLHEDITQVFLTESQIRLKTDAIFSDVANIDDLWKALEGPFLAYFFPQTDLYGDPLSKEGVNGDKWGTWGRVDQYNQVQAAVRFSTSRNSQDQFGQVPYDCRSATNPNISCPLCEANTGFQPTEDGPGKTPNLRNHDCNGGPVVAGDVDWSDQDRRLFLMRPEVASSLPLSAVSEKDKFMFWLYPKEEKMEMRERLAYFKERVWLDTNTNTMEIRLYLLNSELGRPRLEQTSLAFRFSVGGGVYYMRDIQAIMLDLFAGMINVGVDGIWFVLLAITTFIRIRVLVTSFKTSKLFFHLTQPNNLWEWVIIMIGWWNFWGLYQYWNIMKKVKDKLITVRTHGWSLGFKEADDILITDFFATCKQATGNLDTIRICLIWYALILMFRFFVGFGSQPRLAVVTHTMRAVMTDLFHFLIVFCPTFLAYVISGSLLFGRRLTEFSTIQASFGTCFRIGMESEYPWDTLTEEYYWVTAIWTWSFILIVVLLMLNMVLAIILDVYNEVRENSGTSEPIWDTIFNFMVRLSYHKTWVRERDIETTLVTKMNGLTMVRKQDLAEHFPNMPDKEHNMLFMACRKTMAWDAGKDLDKRSLLKLTGSLMSTVDKVGKTTKTVNSEESLDPIHSWITPKVATTPASVEAHNEHDLDTFLSTPVHAKGNALPKTQKFDEADPPEELTGPVPKWLEDIIKLQDQQRKWLNSSMYQLQQMQWQLQLAHVSRVKARGRNEDIL